MPKIPPWLATQWQRLQQNATDGRLAHAILLSGPAGVGKQYLAAELIKLALCSEQQAPACGVCRSCEVAAAGNHPDYHVLQAPEGKNSIGVDQVRAMIEKLSLSPTYNSRKTGLVIPAEAMTHAAANALLKTLEEPPGNTLMVLVSHEAWRLPATIISRCQTVPCGVPERDLATEWLQGQSEGGDWGTCLELAGGAPYLALDYKKHDVDELFESIIEDLIALKSGQSDLISVAGKWSDPQLPVRLISLYKVLRLLLLQSMGLEGELAHKSGFESLHNNCRHIKFSALLGYQDAVLRTRAKLETPLNTQLMLEELLAPWVGGFQNHQLERINP